MYVDRITAYTPMNYELAYTPYTSVELYRQSVISSRLQQWWF